VSSSTANRCRAIRRRGQIRRRVPATAWLRRYDRRQLRPNLLAGCVVAALAVPQALGYVAVIVGYTRDRLRTLGIARKRAGASFLIMTRAPRRSLTGIS
jgi:hypothetical protein